MIKFNRIAPGHLASPDGKYAVVVDGFTPGLLMDPRDACRPNVEMSMGVGSEWAACYDSQGGLRTDHNAGSSLDWFPTAREARAACQRHAQVQA